MATEKQRRQTMFVLDVYAKDDESHLGSFEVRGLTLRDLQEMFDLPPSDPLADCYLVIDAQVERLQQATGRTIDLSKVDAFVSQVRID